MRAKSTQRTQKKAHQKRKKKTKRGLNDGRNSLPKKTKKETGKENQFQLWGGANFKSQRQKEGLYKDSRGKKNSRKGTGKGNARRGRRRGRDNLKKKRRGAKFPIKPGVGRETRKWQLSRKKRIEVQAYHQGKKPKQFDLGPNKEGPAQGPGKNQWPKKKKKREQ